VVNCIEWFKVILHKEMIVVQRKVGKVRNNLVGLVLTLVMKHYSALEYTKEDEEQPIGHFQCLINTRRRTLQVPSIPLIGINRVATSS